MEISGSTPTAFRQAGRPARRERNRRRTSCCGGTPLLLDCITLHSRGGRPVPSSRFCAAAQAGHSDPESHRDDERWTFALFRGKSDGPQPARPTPGGSAGRRRCRPRKDPAPRSASPPSRRSSQPASCLTPGRPPAATQVKELRARRAARGKGRARHRRDRARGPSWLTLTILTPATGRSRMSV